MNLRCTLGGILYSLPSHVPSCIPLIIVHSYPIPVRNSKWGSAVGVRVLYVPPAFILAATSLRRCACMCVCVCALSGFWAAAIMAAFVSHMSPVAQHLSLPSSSVPTVMNCAILCDTTLKRFPQKTKCIN